MIKSKKRQVIAVLTLVTLMTSNLAFSLEYMMCGVGTVTGSGHSGIPAIKNGTIDCEGEDWKTTYRVKLEKLVSEGWKIEQVMSTSTSSDIVKTYFLMRKD